jgi:hypothetical protein
MVTQERVDDPPCGLVDAKGEGCHVGNMRYFVPAVVVVVGTMSAMGARAATSVGASTQMYLGRVHVGEIQREGRRAWHVDCANGPDGDEVFPGARHRAIWVRHWDGYLDGYARLQSTGRWAIHRVQSGQTTAVGFAVRRSSTRWDTLRGHRTVGHTIGPDGPEAAAALLSIC